MLADVSVRIHNGSVVSRPIISLTGLIGSPIILDGFCRLSKLGEQRGISLKFQDNFIALKHFGYVSRMFDEYLKDLQFLDDRCNLFTLEFFLSALFSFLNFFVPFSFTFLDLCISIHFLLLFSILLYIYLLFVFMFFIPSLCVAFFKICGSFPIPSLKNIFVRCRILLHENSN